MLKTLRCQCTVGVFLRSCNIQCHPLHLQKCDDSGTLSLQIAVSGCAHDGCFSTSACHGDDYYYSFHIQVVPSYTAWTTTNVLLPSPHLISRGWLADGSPQQHLAQSCTSFLLCPHSHISFHHLTSCHPWPSSSSCTLDLKQHTLPYHVRYRFNSLSLPLTVSVILHCILEHIRYYLYTYINVFIIILFYLLLIYIYTFIFKS